MGARPGNSPGPEEPAGSRRRFIHRDYHPGNTLWERELLTGVVDWTQASVGDPSVDVGHMRCNLVLDHGPEAAGAFLDAYQRLSGDALGDQPYWDVVTAFDFVGDLDPEHITATGLTRLEEHLAKAAAACS